MLASAGEIHGERRLAREIIEIREKMEREDFYRHLDAYLTGTEQPDANDPAGYSANLEEMTYFLADRRRRGISLRMGRGSERRGHRGWRKVHDRCRRQRRSIRGLEPFGRRNFRMIVGPSNPADPYASLESVPRLRPVSEASQVLLVRWWLSLLEAYRVRPLIAGCRGDL